MNTTLMRGFWAVLLAAAMAPAARAQFQIPTLDQIKGVPTAASGEEENPVSVKAVFTAAEGNQPAQLHITAQVARGWHIYSTTQGKGGPLPTKIKLPPSPNYRLLGQFKATPQPAIHTYPDIYGDLPVEEHIGRVTWRAPVELVAGVDPRQLKIEGKLNVQACDANNCLPPKDYPFTAELGQVSRLPDDSQTTAEPSGDEAKPASLGEYKNPRSHSTIRGHIEPKVAAPGDTVRLSLSAEPADQWHVYALAEKAPAVGSKPTLIVFSETSGLAASAPRASRQPIDKPADGPTGFALSYYEEPVTWTVELKIPRDAQPGAYPISGLMGYHTCWSENCDLPLATQFEGRVVVGEQSQPGEAPLAFSDAKYAEAAKLSAARSVTSTASAQTPGGPEAAAFDPTQIRSNVAEQGGEASVPMMMLFGFLGGLILNLMPCVLPVIGLKILSFVEQSGQDRRRVFMLNIWYSLGLLSVFLVLAGLAIGLGLGWGQQFSSSTFNIVLAGVVFAMGLSFLGVWEIPIPGFVGSGKANDLAAQEGVAGAFSKGVITTVLATPCTGPFLGTALAWAVRQPPYVTVLLFACSGLGMASPYLLIGAFPSLVKFLPKPGMWMETFKQTMGFVLLGTVIFLLTFIGWSLVVPTVAMLFGIWAACWWIGRTPYTADMTAKATAWVGAAVFASLIGLVSFGWLYPVMEERLTVAVDRAIGERLSGQAPAAATKVTESGHKLPWKPFTQDALRDLTGQQQTVMVDFTADWCLICKSLEKLVLNTEDVKEVIDTNQIVPLMADWTSGDEEVTAMLELLGSKNVPVLAIFPAGRPNEPIVFRDPYTQQQLIEALQKAGPSKSAAGQATAMRPR